MAALKETEELELLELENENAQPAVPAKAPNYLQRVWGSLGTNTQSAKEEIAKTAAEDIAAADKNPLRKPLGALYSASQVPLAAAKTILSPVTEIPPLKKFGKWLFTNTNTGNIPYAPYPGMTGTVKTGSNEGLPDVPAALGNIVQKHPLITRAVNTGMNFASVIPVAGGEKAALQAPFEAIRSPLGKSLMKTGNRLENTTLKILDTDAKQGARIENIGKYGLFGKPEKVYTNAKGQISSLANDLDEKLKTAAQNPENNVNVSSMLSKTRENILKNERMSEIEKTKYENAINEIGTELEKPYLDAGGFPKDVNLLEAQLLKRYVGKSGDWLSNPGGGMRPSPEATIKAKVYNSIYDQLKKELENKGGEGIKEINTALSELIPLERAAGRRMLVTTRKNPISIEDFIGGLTTAATIGTNPLPALLTLGNIASKSPLTAKGIYGLGKLVKGTR